MPNRIAYGLPGHENEFCVNFTEYNHAYAFYENFIPDSMADKIEEALAPYGFYVENRGTRIEILPSGGMWKDVREGDCLFVFDMIKKLFPDREFDTYFRIYNNSIKVVK